jgi:hypothetical protein
MSEFKNFEVVIAEKMVRLQVEDGCTIGAVKESLFRFMCYLGKLEESLALEMKQREQEESDKDEIKEEDGSIE